MGVGLFTDPPSMGRAWFPGWDWPCDKATAELHIETNFNRVGVANGVLVSVDSTATAHTWNWRHDYPISTYLIAMSVAKYQTLADSVVTDPRITEAIGVDTVLCGNTLHPVGATNLTGRELEELTRGRTFGPGNVADLVTEILPAPTGTPSHYPGQVCTINVSVYNYAVNPASNFHVICAVNDGFDNSTIQSILVTTSLAPYQGGLDNKTFQFQYTPPLIPPPYYSFPHTYKVVATVSIANDEVQLNNQKQTNLNVQQADFQPNMILGLYALMTFGWKPCSRATCFFFMPMTSQE